MSLQDYDRKQDFSRAPKPRPEAWEPDLDQFVVQCHQASHLHDDFQLELAADQAVAILAVP